MLHTPELQSQRGRRYGQVRATKAGLLAEQAKALRDQGYKQKDIAIKLGITQARISQLLKKVK